MRNNKRHKKTAKFESDSLYQAIRGGIPICFPAFGAWEFGAQHGLARTSKDWKVAQEPKVDPETGDVEVRTTFIRDGWKIRTLSINLIVSKSHQFDHEYQISVDVTF